MDGERVPSKDVEGNVEKVLGSTTFRGAERSRRLLRFIVDETLQGRADRLKDYTLGAEALGRGDEFDPRTDPIARVEMSRLRSRLDVYYATEGASDDVKIVVPKGGYVPLFERRSTAAGLSSAANAAQDPVGAAGAREQSSGAWSWSAVAAPFAAAVLAAGSTWWLARSQARPVDALEIRLG